MKSDWGNYSARYQKAVSWDSINTKIKGIFIFILNKWGGLSFPVSVYYIKGLWAETWRIERNYNDYQNSAKHTRQGGEGSRSGM